jgi:hypothetical protein
MAFYFEASYKEVKARIKTETAVQAEELRMALSRQGVRVGEPQQCDRSFYRPLAEVKRERQILEVLK